MVPEVGSPATSLNPAPAMSFSSLNTYLNLRLRKEAYISNFVILIDEVNINSLKKFVELATLFDQQI